VAAARKKIKPVEPEPEISEVVEGDYLVLEAQADAVAEGVDSVVAIVPVSTIPEMPLDQNPAAIYLSALRPSGRPTMISGLNKVAELLSNGRHTALTMPWHELRYQHTAALRSRLQDFYSPATTNKILSAVRRVLQEAWRLGQLPSEDYQRAVDLKNIKNSRLPRGRALKDKEVKTLLQLCKDDPRPTGKRDLAILALLWAGGLRRSEVVALDLRDYDPEENSVTVRGGKGGKDRVVYLARGIERPILEWLDVRGDLAGPLFHPITYKGNLLKKRLSDQSIAYVMKGRVRAAGLEAASPHDMRRTFISNLLDAGADISTVQQLAGHASVTTTARYDRRGAETKKRAAKLLVVPDLS
jgi:site-specific recombinase XerD